mmetsp:Transcript_39305/g.88565  ORF Transcript_39305/g.88565 Transcript_39305/m.88565 type:complete len:390 (+) Transcript_39305:684-1853(+)
MRTEAAVAADAPGPSRLCPPQHVAEARLAVAHHHKLHAVEAILGVLHEPLRRLAQEVHALLRREPSNEAHDAGAVVLLKAESLLQSALAGQLARHVVNAEFRGDAFVAGGVPGVVDAVEDASKIEALCGNHIVEAETALRCADLVRVTRGNREDSVAAKERGLCDVQRLARVALVGALVQRVLVDQVAQGLEGQAQLSEVVKLDRRDAEAQRVAALVAKVVHHEQAAGVVVVAIGAVTVLHIDRQEPSLPVVRNERHLAPIARRATNVDGHRHLKGGQREESEAKEVVLVLFVGRRVVVEAPCALEGRVVDEDVVAALAAAVRLVVVEVPHLVHAPEKLEGLGALIEGAFIGIIHGGDGHGPVPAHGKVVSVGRRDNGQAAGLRPRVQL